MTSPELVARNLPYLRRYARALSGSQAAGDAIVAATLESLVASPEQFPTEIDPRTALYKVFHTVLPSVEEPQDESGQPATAGEQLVQKRLATLVPSSRWALLLTTLEGFSHEQAAVILDRQLVEIRGLVDHAVSEIDRQMSTSVLIIEDEPIIALDLEEIVRSMGHTAIGPADTRDKAVEAFRETPPGLVLADVKLADGSSGIDAVNDILSQSSVPVIFITAYPEQLLTGDKAEPTFLITKPFQADEVKAAISQALFFEQEAVLAT